MFCVIQFFSIIDLFSGPHMLYFGTSGGKKDVTSKLGKYKQVMTAVSVGHLHIVVHKKDYFFSGGTGFRTHLQSRRSIT
jgi:hypothetical protein